MKKPQPTNHTNRIPLNELIQQELHAVTAHVSTKTNLTQHISQDDIHHRKKQFLPHLKNNIQSFIITNKKMYKQQENIDYIFQLFKEHMTFIIGKGMHRQLYLYLFDSGHCFLNKEPIHPKEFFKWIEKMDQDTLENKVLAYEET